MKISNLVLLFLISILLSCAKDNVFQEQLLEFTSPKGISIAKNETELRTDINETVWSVIGQETNYNITSITYHENRFETAAIIMYESSVGIIGKLVILVELDEFNREREKYKLTCEGGICCELTLTPTSGGFIYNCGCSGCQISIEPLD